MRSCDEMMHTIFEVAASIEGVEAIAMNGSRANLNARIDEFQDYDIVYFVKYEKMQELVEERNWINAFGQRLLLQTPADFAEGPLDLNERFNFLMLFTDGNRIDLGICPVSKIEDWRKEDPVGIILYDPKALLPDDLYTNDEIYWQKQPTEKEFKNCCNEFWWVSTYVVKGICRNELLYAESHFRMICFQEYLKLLSWSIADRFDYRINIGKSYKYLLEYLDEQKRADILKLLNLSSLEKLSEALIILQRKFDSCAKESAEKNHFDYNREEAANSMNYTLNYLKR